MIPLWFFRPFSFISASTVCGGGEPKETKRGEKEILPRFPKLHVATASAFHPVLP